MASDPETTALFKKFRLIPVEGSSSTPSISKVEKAEQFLRNYNPVLRAMANNYEGMQDALHGRKRGHTAKSRLNLLNVHNARLQHIQNQATHTDETSIPEIALVKADKPVRAMQTPDEPLNFNQSIVKYEDLQLPKLALPKSCMAKFEQLMSVAGGALKPGRFGELVIQDKIVAGSSFSDVMRALLVNGKKSQENPVGLMQSVTELKRLGVSDNFLTSKRARTMYAEVDTNQTGSGRFTKKKARKILRLY